jgi:hypothetical protein
MALPSSLVLPVLTLRAFGERFQSILKMCIPREMLGA